MGTQRDRVIPVVVCIDVEPAGRRHVDPRPGPWPGVIEVGRWLDRRRADIEAATGRPAHYSWFLRMDPQLGEVFGSAGHAYESHRELLGAGRERGDELGLHIHAWRPAARPGEWVDDLGDPDWVDACIDGAFAAYADAIGEPCRVTRMGFRFWSRRVRRRLAGHGVEVDLSQEAAQRPVADGDQPDVRGALPDQRWVPRRPAGRRPVRLPLSATRRLVGPGLRAGAWRLRSGRGRRLDQPFTLRHEPVPPDSFTARIDRCLASQRRPYLAFALQTGDLGPELRARIDDHLDLLLAHPAAGRMAFTTPRDAVRLLRRH